MHDDGLALGVGVRVRGRGVGVGAQTDLGGLLLDDGGDALVAVEGVEGGDGQPVEDDGEEDEPVDDGDHGRDEVFFFVGHGFAGLGEEVARVLDVEDGADACEGVSEVGEGEEWGDEPMGPK